VNKIYEFSRHFSPIIYELADTKKCNFVADCINLKRVCGGNHTDAYAHLENDL
jgi:hypothetical protein